MCAKILEAAGKLNVDEYNFFLRGGIVSCSLDTRYTSLTLNYQLLNMNLINEILLSVLYFMAYDCVYTDFVLSSCFVIFTEFYCMIFVYYALCILFMYCCKHVRLTCVQ